MPFHSQRTKSGGGSRARIRVVWRTIVGLAICIPFLGMNSAIAGSTAAKAAWDARIVVPGNFSGLMSAEGSLYAVKYAAHGPLAHGSRLVRIDPVSGRVLAQSSILPNVAAPIYADHALWLSGATFFSADARTVGPAEMFKLNPSNLKIVVRVLTNYSGYPTIFGGPKGIVWAEWRNQDDCVLRRISPTTGVIMTKDQVRLRRGGCVGATLDTSGAFLYVATTENAPSTLIYKLNGVTGATISHIDVNGLGTFESMAASGGHLWMADGDPGGPGILQFLTTSPLRMIAESQIVKGNGGPNNLGPYGYALPNFGQFPSINISAGTLWVGSDAGIACFAPSSQQTEAFVNQVVAPILTDSFARVDERVWANAAFGVPSPGNGLARIDPPVACTR